MALTDIDKVRLYIQDLNEDVTQRFFTDEELQFFIDEEVSLRYAAAAALESLAADVAKVSKSQSGGTFSSSKSGLSSALLEMAAALRQKEIDEPYSGTLEHRTYPWIPLDRTYGEELPWST